MTGLWDQAGGWLKDGVLVRPWPHSTPDSGVQLFILSVSVSNQAAAESAAAREDEDGQVLALAGGDLKRIPPPPPPFQ